MFTDFAGFVLFINLRFWRDFYCFGIIDTVGFFCVGFGFNACELFRFVCLEVVCLGLNSLLFAF